MSTGGNNKKFELLEPRYYNLTVDECEITMAKSNPNCIMAKTVLSVADGDKKGLKVWDSYILQHQNETPRRIGREKIDQLLTAIGHGGLATLNEDFSILPELVIGKTVNAKVKIDISKNPDFSDRNRVEKFKAGY